MSNLNRHIKSDAVKWIVVGVLIIAIIATIVLGCFSSWFTNWDTSTWFGGEKTEQTEPEPEEDNGGAVITDVIESGISLMSAVIPVSEYEDYGISTLSETSYTLTATVTPSYAANPTVVWSVEWVNPSAEWVTTYAGTHPASYFVQVTPSGEHNHTAVVTMSHGEIGEQVKIVCASEDDPDIKAECTVDYMRRIREWKGTVVTAKRLSRGSVKETIDYRIGETITVDYKSTGRTDPSYSNTFDRGFTFTHGTITPTYTATYTLQMSEEFTASLGRQGLAVNFTDRTITETTDLVFDSEFLTGIGVTPTSSSESFAKFVSALNDLENATRNKYAFRIKCDYVLSSGQTSTNYVYIKLNTASMAIVENVSLDNSSLIF